MLTPDHDRDIFIYEFAAVDALTGAPIGDRWSVWCGRESEGSFDSEAEALAAAWAVAGDGATPVWLIQRDGRPQLISGP